MLVDYVPRFDASFLPNLIDLLCLRVAYMPTSRDMMIFVLMMMPQPITLPFEQVRGVTTIFFLRLL